MAKESQREEFKAEDVAHHCDCGKTHLLRGVFHYDRVFLSCQRIVWALRPRRGGPLEMHPWPGQNLTREEMADQRNEEWKNARLRA